MKRDQDPEPSDPEPSDPEPSDPEARDPEPSDPDAAMYAAIAARPHWIEKPIVQKLIKELSEGLGPGEDILYWDMRRSRPAQPSDAAEHRILTVTPQAESLSQTLPSARVIVQDAAHATYPSPGRNGPRPEMDGPDEGGKALSRSSRQRPPSVRVPRWCLAATVLVIALLSAALTLLVLSLGTWNPALGPVPPAVHSCKE